MAGRSTTRVLVLAAALATPLGADARTVEELERELEAMQERMQRMETLLQQQHDTIQRLERTQAATPSAVATPPPATPKAATAAVPAPAAPATAAGGNAALDAALAAAQAEAPAARPAESAPLARPLGPATLRLVDISFDTMAAFGWSTATNDQLAALQAGGHDPNKRGFTLQQAELSAAGAVDPYFNGEAYMVFTEDSVELEEAFLTTTSLPYGLQFKAGKFLAPFGRINPTHPHAWDWLDQPVINSRLFGSDGFRNPGAQLGWLLPVPWYSQLIVDAYNAGGAEAFSFFHEPGPTGIAGHPLLDRQVGSLADMVYLTRLESGGALTDTLSGVLGATGMYGPNATGAGARTEIWGADAVLKWRPSTNFRGWPFVTWQSEVMGRSWDAAAVPGTATRAALPSETLHDWGLYTEALYGFTWGWAAGLRYEFATGNGPTVDPSVGNLIRHDRQRISPLLVWQPTEYSRIRLQYDIDDADHLGWENTVWLGFEINYGQHPAHKY